MLDMLPYCQCFCEPSQFNATSSCAPVISHAGDKSYTPTSSHLRAISMYWPGRNLEEMHQTLCLPGQEQRYHDLKEFLVGQKISIGREDFVNAGDIPVRWKLKLDPQLGPLINWNVESMGNFTLAQASRASPYPYLTYYVSSLLSILNLPGAYRYHAYSDQTDQVGLFSAHFHIKSTEKSALNLEVSNLCSSPLLAPVVGVSYGQGQIDKQGLSVQEPTHQTKYPKAVGAKDFLAFAVCQQFISGSVAEMEDRQSPLDVKGIVKLMGRFSLAKSSCPHVIYKNITSLLGIWRQQGTYHVQDLQLDILAIKWRDRKSPQDMKEFVESMGRFASPRASLQYLYLTCYKYIAKLLRFGRPPKGYPHDVKSHQLDSSFSAKDRRDRQRPPDIMGIAEPTCRLAMAKGSSAYPHATYKYIANLLGILRQPVMYPYCAKCQQLDRSAKERCDRQKDTNDYLEPICRIVSAVGSSFPHPIHFRYIPTLLGFESQPHYFKGQCLHIPCIEEDRKDRSVGMRQMIAMAELDDNQQKSDSSRNQHHSASNTGHGGSQCRMILGSQVDNFQHNNGKHYRQMLFELSLLSGITKDVVDRGRMSSSTHQPPLKLSSKSQDAHYELSSPAGLCP